jgi:hypothetical protein
MTQAESDQPALGPDGQLLDASKITWYNDPDDSHPIQPTSRPSMVQEGMCLTPIPYWRPLIFLSGQVGERSCPTRATAGTRLAEAIAAEKLDEYGSSCRRFIQPRDVRTSTKRKRQTTINVPPDNAIGTIDSDAEDETFALSVSKDGCDADSPDSEAESNGIEIGNEEVRIIISCL